MQLPKGIEKHGDHYRCRLSTTDILGRKRRRSINLGSNLDEAILQKNRLMKKDESAKLTAARLKDLADKMLGNCWANAKRRGIRNFPASVIIFVDYSKRFNYTLVDG